MKTIIAFCFVLLGCLPLASHAQTQPAPSSTGSGSSGTMKKSSLRERMERDRDNTPGKKGPNRRTMYTDSLPRGGTTKVDTVRR